MKWCNSILALIVAATACMLIAPPVASADEVIVKPGWISGQILTNTPNSVVRNISVSASGGGYSSSRNVTGNAYSLTVQGGSWNYSVNVTATSSPSGQSYPYTSLSFSARSFPVAEGQTVTNHYYPTGTVRFQLNITGDAYSSWYAYGYATKAAASGSEQTNSQSYTNKSSTPNGAWDMPVVPNDQIRIYAQVVIDNKTYSFWTSSPYRYENIGQNQTIVIPLDIQHVKLPHCQNGVRDADETGVDCGGADCAACPPPVQYDYGSVQGSTFLNLLVDSTDYSSFFSNQYTWGYTGSYTYTNPGNYSQTSVRTGTYIYRTRTQLNDSGRSSTLTWPYTSGYSQNDYVTVYKDQTSIKDFRQDAGTLSGTLKFKGTLKLTDLAKLSYVGFSVAGAQNFTIPGQGSVRQITYGGSTSNSFSSGPDNTYRFFLTPGPWFPYTFDIRGSKTVTVSPTKKYTSSFQTNFYDYNHYYDGGTTYNFGKPTYITAGTGTVQDREYCTGSLNLRFRVNGGGLLSNPYVNGTGNHYNAAGQRDIYASTFYATANASQVEMPELDLHGPPGNYTLSTVRVVTQDGSTLYLTPISVQLKCGVWVGRDTSGPAVDVISPEPEIITNATSVTVTGTASDDTDVTGVTVNGVSVPFTPTGNPDVPNEVSFSYPLATTSGMNTIVTRATDAVNNVGSDTRSIYVDRWMPTATILSPANGAIISSAATVPVSVQAADQGYGFTLKVYVDSTLIYETSGPANENAPETISFTTDLGGLANGSHTIRADVSDLAGNSATASVTFSINAPPTVSANGPYAVDEGGSVLVSATGSDAEGGSLSYAWDLDNDGIFETPGQNATLSAAALDGVSSRTISVKAVDNVGFSSVAQTSVVIANVAPTAVFTNASGVIAEGGSANLLFTNQYDPGVADTTAGFLYFFDCTNDGTFESSGSSATSSICQYPDNGSYTAAGRIQDKDGAYTDYTVQVIVNNVAPTAVFSNASGVIAEGGSANLLFTNQYDPGVADTAAGFLYFFDCTNDGTFESSGSSSATFACQYPDNGSYVAAGRIQDKDGGYTDYTAIVTVANVAPTVSAITAPIDPAVIQTTIAASAQFTDPGVLDTHTAQWNWGDGTTTAGVVEEVNGSGTVRGSHAYAAAGVYTVSLTVTDKDGGSGAATYSFVVIYDPGAGFVTGGGWINSPAGAYTPDPAIAGKVNLGFVAKYHNGAAVPIGQTEFNLSIGRMNFHSEDYAWLVVTGGKAQYTGTGTVNGSGRYGFTVTVIDDKLAGGMDRFRIKIWDLDRNDAVVYDNQAGLADNADPTSAIEKGSIVIHTTS